MSSSDPTIGSTFAQHLNAHAPVSPSSPPPYSQAMQQSVEVSSSLSDEKNEGHTSSMSSHSSYYEIYSKVVELQKMPLRPGDSWFIIGHDWFQSLSAISSEQTKSYDEELPLEGISTRYLLEQVEPSVLLKGLEEGVHIEMVPQQAWNLLVSYFGVHEPPIERKVIQLPSSDTTRLELYPPRVNIFHVDENVTHLGTSVFSVTQTLRDVKTVTRALLQTHLGTDGQKSQNFEDMRFWRLPRGGVSSTSSSRSLKEDGSELLASSSDDITLAELQIDQPEEELAVELRKTNTDWHFDENGNKAASSLKGVFSNDGGAYLTNLHTNRDSIALVPSPSGESSSNRVTRSQTAAERDAGKLHGLTGLYNLGNTCFMNSALQCMSNTKELKDYFVSGVYKAEVNTSNPLGMGGAMAKVFGELLVKLWSATGNAWHPREFKTVLSRFSPQFIGYSQQDTQELLAFLLDGLHEDLNRIVKKPYIEAPDWEGGGIREMVAFARKQWEIYKLRNDSVIVDLFQGQYRSTLVCPECGKVSIKFDPFMYLTLPIPNRQSITRRVTFFGRDMVEPVEVEMRFSGETSVAQLKRKLASIMSVSDARNLIVCDYFQRSFYRIYGDFESTLDIGVNDITYVYELPSRIQPIAPTPRNSFSRSMKIAALEEESQNTNNEEEMAILPVFSVIRDDSSDYAPFYHKASGNTFGVPFFVSIPKDKVNDADYIQQSLFTKYLSLTSHKEEMTRFFESQISPSINEVTNTEEWDMLEDSKVIPPSAQVEGRTVAEISSEGQNVLIVPDDSSSDTTQLESQNNVPSSHSGNGFSVHVIVHREDQAPITLKPDNYLDIGEDLQSRACRLGLKEHVDNDGDLVHVESLKSKWPLIYTGGALVCEWSKGVKENLFGEEEWGSPLKIINDPELEAERQPEAKRVKRALTIEDCLKEFTKEEQLGESDPWYCPNCKDFKQATKKFDLWKVPDILVVHLKRFSSGRIGRDKIDSFIDFPITGLDLTERVEGAKAIQMLNSDESDDEKLMDSIGSLDANDDAVESDVPIYDLYAVDNHYGGLGGGHYTAFAKNPDGGKWYEYDDSNVRLVSDVESVKSSAAYLLFYRRRTTRPIGGKSRDKVQRKQQSDSTEDELSSNNGSVKSSDGSKLGSEGTNSEFSVAHDRLAQRDEEMEDKDVDIAESSRLRSSMPYTN